MALKPELKFHYESQVFTIKSVKFEQVSKMDLLLSESLALLDMIMTYKVDKVRTTKRKTWDSRCKVFIGGLRHTVMRRNIIVSEEIFSLAIKLLFEDIFSPHGHVINCWVARRPGGFGFVQMGSRREARQAVRKLDGSYIHGFKV